LVVSTERAYISHTYGIAVHFAASEELKDIYLIRCGTAAGMDVLKAIFEVVLLEGI
jgi:hypothetical protein